MTQTFQNNKNNNNNIQTTNNLNIITHNVQGLNNRLKLQIWLEFCHKSQYHIISMTETKIVKLAYSEFILSNSYYKIYIANCNSTTAIKQESSMSIAIAVLNLLQPYIHNILTLFDTALAVDFYFLNNK